MDLSAHLPGLAPRAAVRSLRHAAGRPAAPTDVVPSVVATGAAAFAVEVLTGEHTTHTVGLVLVVATIAALSRLIGPRYRGLAPVLAAAVMAQPAMHLAGRWVGRWVGSADGHAGDGAATWAGALHHLISHRTTWGQIAATLLIVAAVLTCGIIADLVFSFARARIRRLTQGSGPVRDLGVRLSSARRQGSMLRWCGWTLRAARRGPPRPTPLPLV